MRQRVRGDPAQEAPPALSDNVKHCRICISEHPQQRIRIVTVKEHLAVHDRQINAIRDLIREGMRLVIETRKDMGEVVAVQKRTEQTLEMLVNPLKRGSNGRSKTKIDLQ